MLRSIRPKRARATPVSRTDRARRANNQRSSRIPLATRCGGGVYAFAYACLRSTSDRDKVGQEDGVRPPGDGPVPTVITTHRRPYAPEHKFREAGLYTMRGIGADGQGNSSIRAPGVNVIPGSPKATPARRMLGKGVDR
jgi:hypothetical protein